MLAITRRLKREKRGISTVIVAMLSLVLVVIIVGNVVLWSYQMNQLDLERMQETITIANVTRATNSPWYTAQNEYATNGGTQLNGTYTDTRNIDSNYEIFREETTLTNYTFNPSGYILGGSTTYLSGAVSDLTTDNSAYMVFRSYPSASTAQTLYSHSEIATIAGQTYYQLKLSSADTSGVRDFQVSASTTGRKLLAKYVYPLTGVATIPASTWTIYYRAYKDHPNVAATCDADILIRKADGTTRTTIATQVANSASLTGSWTTVSGTYSWNSYNVVNDTDFLEIDYYAEITSNQSNKSVYLRVDDPSLPVTDQTRIAGVALPTTYTVQVELPGSSNTQNWQSLAWTVNSAFTTATVNTTLQLYNYYTSQYPANGDGYITYTSNSTPNTDDTRSQTIAANPTYYRNSTGAWKIRITGVKDTTSPFDLKLDWVEFKASVTGIYRLNITNTYTLDLQTCPIDYIHGIEVLLRYNASNSDEKWFLKAYDWTASSFSDTGFNNTGGSLPTLNQWNEYAINITSNWTNYLAQNGTILIEFFDQGISANQTAVGIDFLGARAIIDGTSLDLKNSSPLSIHIVTVWIENSTIHQRYNADLFMNSGESTTYIRADIRLPHDAFLAKVVTERGNIAVFSED